MCRSRLCRNTTAAAQLRDARPHGRQVRDGVEFFAMKYSSHRCALAKIDLVNPYVFDEPAKVGALDLRVVKIVEVVENRHFVSRTEQFFRKMRADETGAACNQNSHATID